MYELFLKGVEFVAFLGYWGLFIMAVVESTFIPLPCEIVLVPAGYLIAKGEMNLWIVLTSGIVGTITGALLSYGIARRFGRPLVKKYGIYVLFSKEKLQRMEDFFRDHGPISAFIGRIMPGIKHFIAFPAGLAKMDLKLFSIYTFIGGTLWICILVLLGYFIGNNEETVKFYIKRVNIAAILGVMLLIAVYALHNKRKKATQKQD